jgi:diguanylate cyclase (GGDEF)-like protein
MQRHVFRRLGRVAEPQVLFPLFAVVLLSVIWGTTYSIVRSKRADAAQSASISSHELLDTYEAQVVRALHDIDQTLILVQSWPTRSMDSDILPSLRDKGLLPPDLLFTVSIADRAGVVVDSTRPSGLRKVARQDYFTGQRDSDSLFIGRLPPGPTGAAQLQFSRRLTTPTGEFDGAVIVAVDADYFVSGYETVRFGVRGVIGLVGTDGVFRVRRSGDAVVSGETIDYASVVSGDDDATKGGAIMTSAWDGVRRWTSARELYGVPLAVLVGLSVDEQAATAKREARTYLWWAALASVVALLSMAVLGRLSWQVAQGRLRENEAKLAHAARAEYLAFHDGLTDLPNRSMFSKLLTERISEARRYDRKLAVAFLDLDRFKQLNDTLGHEAGDQLLQQFAIRLKDCVRDSDTVARLGGDEFVLLLPDLGDGRYAAVVAEKILHAAAKPFALKGQSFRVTASIGISTYPDDGGDEQTLTKNADIAMYQAKAEGKNNFQFYSEALNANSLQRLTLESSLRHAYEHKEFKIVYQAKRDIASGQISGMEALLRWEHPELGTVEPMKFIPVAEETGLIVPIGKWVLRTVCTQSVAWQKEGLPPLCIAVNLSARQFYDEALIPELKEILASTGLNANLLEIELAESLLMRDIEKTLNILTRLKLLGVRIAIDDFGTGYASLTTLQRFPLDTIKIDRSFVRNFTGADEDTKLADAVIAMGKALSLTVVAQGVETRGQAEFLRIHSCDELQGFYFKRPLPAAEFAELIRAQVNEVTYIGRRIDSQAS